MSNDLRPLSGPVNASGEPVQRLLVMLKDVIADMDRAGGDGYGMPECPWCQAQGDDKEQHFGDCELAAAWKLIAEIESAAAAVPSSPAQPDERVEELAAQFITAIEHDPAIATDMASVESWLRRAAALPPSSPVADSPKCDPRNGCAQCNPDYPSAPSPSAGAAKDEE